MKTGFRNPKGITLIALVVTIVVLLILAGVSISLVLGENGLISKAKEGRDKYAEAAENEQAQFNDIDAWLDETISGSGTGGSGEKTLYQAVIDGDRQIGDYVTYTPNASGTYTSETEENGWADQTYNVDTSTQWRILGTQGNQVILIAADPIKKAMTQSVSKTGIVPVSASAEPETTPDQTDPYLIMKGAYGYVNCETMLDNICGIYSTNLGTARSLTIEDINNVLGVEVETDKVYFKSDLEKTNIDLSVNNGSNTGLGKPYTYKEGDYTPESYLAGNNATAGETVTQDAYWYDYTGLMSNTIGSTTIGNLLFDGTLEADNFAKSYWLASPAAYVLSSFAFFGPGYVYVGYAGPGYSMFSSFGYWFAHRFAVRPVVVLNSNVTVSQVPATTGSTQPWSFDNSNSLVSSGNASNGLAGSNVSNPT